MSEETSQKCYELARFGQLVLDELKESITEECYEIEVDSLVDLAVKSGLMLREVYDPSKHENISGDVEPGDVIYYWGTGKDAV